MSAAESPAAGAGRVATAARQMLSAKAERFTESVIREMTRLAMRHNAVNMAQGFPDFPASAEVKEAARQAISDDINQYAITWGAKELRDAIARKFELTQGVRVDPERETWLEARQREAKELGYRTQPGVVIIGAGQGGIALAELLLSKGMGVEAGMGSVLATEKFLESKLAARCRWVLLEPEQQEMDAALAVVGKIEELLQRAGIALPIILHGLNRTAWEFIEVAARRGYGTRIGLEDVLTLPDGRQAKANGELVAEALRRAGRARAANKG